MHVPEVTETHRFWARLFFSRSLVLGSFLASSAGSSMEVSSWSPELWEPPSMLTAVKALLLLRLVCCRSWRPAGMPVMQGLDVTASYGMGAHSYITTKCLAQVT